MTASMATPALAACALRLRGESPRRPRGPPLTIGRLSRESSPSPRSHCLPGNLLRGVRGEEGRHDPRGTAAHRGPVHLRFPEPEGQAERTSSQPQAVPPLGPVSAWDARLGSRGTVLQKWDLLHRPWRLTSPPLPLPYHVTKERWAGRSQPLPQPNPAAPEVALGTGQTPSHPGHQAQGLSARPLLLKLPQSPSANSLDPTAQLNFQVRTQAPLKLTLRTEVGR